MLGWTRRPGSDSAPCGCSYRLPSMWRRSTNMAETIVAADGSGRRPSEQGHNRSQRFALICSFRPRRSELDFLDELDDLAVGSHGAGHCGDSLDDVLILEAKIAIQLDLGRGSQATFANERCDLCMKLPKAIRAAEYAIVERQLHQIAGGVGPH